jgi:hypothetical protein
MKRQQWLVFVPMTLATAGLAACASVLGGEEVKVRPVDTMQTLTGAPRDALYESAVSAINERDYGRALEYLQAAKAKDTRNVKALNALGVVYDKLGRFDLSARYYAQARTIEPDSKIIAENMGYSRVLQRLLNPNQPVAVASIDLPPGLTDPASPAGAPPTPAQSSVTADLVPVMPVAEKKLIDATPPAIAAAPLPLPDVKPLMASVILYEPPVTERKLIDAPLPIVTATPVKLPDATHVFANIALPAPAVPVVERKLIDTPPPTVTAMPVELPDAKRLFAEVTLPEPIVPVTEKKVIDAAPPTVTASPFMLPDTKPFFAASLSPAVLSLPVPGTDRVAAVEPAASAATMSVITARPVAAAPISLAPVALVMTMAEQKAVVESAPSAVTVPVAAPTKPAIAAMSVSSPQAEEKTVSVAAVPAVLAAPATPKPEPVAPRPAAPAVEKKTMAALAAPVFKPSIAKPIVVANARALPTVARLSAKPVAASVRPVAARPAVPVLPARQVLPLSAAKQAAAMPAKGKVLTIGQPIKLVNASGKPGGAGTVLRRLTNLGWTMRPADSRIQPVTLLFYPVQNLAAAKAMQRTLPFPVRLIAVSGKASGMQLVIGRDYLSWKPRNSRIAALWQKRLVLASAQKPSLRGVR